MRQILRQTVRERLCSESWKVRQALKQTGRETVLREVEGETGT